MLIILGSIFYFFSVLGSEIGVGLGWQICAFGKNKKGKSGDGDGDGDEEEEEASASRAAESMEMTSSPLSNPMHNEMDKSADTKNAMKAQLEDSQEALAEIQKQLAAVSKTLHGWVRVSFFLY
jgi:hypothetical protein